MSERNFASCLIFFDYFLDAFLTSLCLPTSTSLHTVETRSRLLTRDGQKEDSGLSLARRRETGKKEKERTQRYI